MITKFKTFENRFTSIFKPRNNMTKNFMRHSMDDNYNDLMNAAQSGNWKIFKELLPQYRQKINDIHTIYLDSGTEAKENVLTWVVFGNGDLWEKKKMFSALIENGVDYLFRNEDDKTFYDRLKTNPDLNKLRIWIEEKYPDIIEKVIINNSTKKYNI
jgi:hypothetical protein